MSDMKTTHSDKTSADGTTEEINLLELLQVIVKRRNFILKVCTAAAILAVVYSISLKNVYTASAKILPPQKDAAGGLSALLSQAGGLAGLAAGGMGLGGSTEMYVGIIKSRSVTDAVIQRLNLQKEFKTKTADETRRRLATVIKVKAGKDGIINIDADSKDPVKAALLANTLVDELGKRSVQLNLSKAGAERMFLEKRLQVVKQDLRAAEEAMKLFQEKYKTIKADSQAMAAIEGIAQLKADIIGKEVQLASLRQNMTDEAPEVRMLMAAVARLKNQLGGMTGNGRMDVIPAAGNVPSLGVEYVRKLRELKVQEAIFEQLTKQYEVAKLSEAKDSSSFQILDEAVVPAQKSKPKRSLIVILITVSAFILSLFVIFIQEYISKLSSDDVQVLENIKMHLFSRHR